MATQGQWRFAAFFGAALVVALLAASSVAWACVPQPRLLTVQPRSSGPAGSEVTVAALGFDPGRAEVRWNAIDGELLASGNGPDFSVTVTIPEAPDGLYNLVVLARSPNGEIGNTGTLSFQVTSSRGTPDAPWSAASTPVGQQYKTSTGSISASAVLLAGTAGAAVALSCFGGLIVLRRSRRASTADSS